MEGQTPTKLSLDSLMSTVLPSLDVDTSAGNNTAKKFKRVRPPPGSTPPPPVPAAQTSTVPAAQTAPMASHIPKGVPSDIAAAAQAVFSAPTSSSIPIATPGNNSAVDNTHSINNNNPRRRQRKQKKKTNGENSQGGPAGSTNTKSEPNTSTPNGEVEPSTDQKQQGTKRKNNRDHQNRRQRGKWSKNDPQMIARNLDAQPELVGVAKDDDFSTLLLQHVEHSNKILQRDLQEQSRKMLAEQKLQAELLAAQVAGLAPPVAPSLSDNNNTDNAESSSSNQNIKQEQKQHKHPSNNQQLTHQNRNTNNSNGQPQQKRPQTPFIPKKDCIYFLQGTCRKAVCTFKHDISAQQAAMAAQGAESEIKREANRKARGICNYEKSGSCAKGDQCPFSHDLSEEPCTYYHLRGICERGALCRFGHSAISPERLRKLREDFEAKKIRERNEMQANAGAGAGADASAQGAGGAGGAAPFQIGVVSIGTLFEELVRCRLVGELLIGLLFGNLAVGTLLPADKTLLILAGEVGVLGLVFEAGLGTDIRRVMKTGPRAALVAFVGIVVPLATGFGFMYGLAQQSHIREMDYGSRESGRESGKERDSSDVVIEAIASGASLASTSIAIAVTMMKQQGVLETPIGTLITTAAMLDDVVSLILLGIVSSIGGSESGSDSGIRPMTVIQPVLASLGIIVMGVIACAIVARAKARKASAIGLGLEIQDGQRECEGMDDIGNRTESSTVEGKGSGAEKQRGSTRSHHGIENRIFVLYSKFESTLKLAGMLIVGFGYSILAEYLGSSRLLGAFMAGVFFSAFEDLAHRYEMQVANKIQPVMSAIFFATIGLAIPLTKILEPVLFGWGIVYAVIASLSKVATMVVVPARISSPKEEEEDSGDMTDALYNARWMVGAAMIARGELGLLMVQQAQMQGVMGQTAMVITTWAIVLATLFGVGAFSLVMKCKS
ncbi:hypothetical protein BGX23_003993 [Mortierella sp. AD031]|nr:hypothetical protein BGX23_003993 [Mortierella sp. AD031]